MSEIEKERGGLERKQRERGIGLDEKGRKGESGAERGLEVFFFVFLTGEGRKKVC